MVGQLMNDELGEMRNEWWLSDGNAILAFAWRD
jgi:hypothetical protein